MIHRSWLWHVEFALEGTVMLEAGTIGISRIPTDINRMKLGPATWGAK